MLCRRNMGDGKRALAPCRHVGEYVLGQYVECELCDRYDDEDTLDMCEHIEFYDSEVDRYGAFGFYKETMSFCVACGARLYTTIGKVKVKF
jgi:hypothetical protein